MREPATWVIRARSAQSFFSIRATWSSGSKSKLGDRPFLPDDDVGALVRPDRRALPGDVGHAQQQRVERRLLLAQRRLDLADLGADRLGLGAERRPLLGRGALEAVADRVALGPQRRRPASSAPRTSPSSASRASRSSATFFCGDRLADGVGIVADEGQAQHARIPAGAAAKNQERLAETEGFEPSVGVIPLRRFSKPLVSATHPRLRDRPRAAYIGAISKVQPAGRPLPSAARVSRVHRGAAPRYRLVWREIDSARRRFMDGKGSRGANFAARACGGIAMLKSFVKSRRRGAVCAAAAPAPAQIQTVDPNQPDSWQSGRRARARGRRADRRRDRAIWTPVEGQRPPTAPAPPTVYAAPAGDAPRADRAGDRAARATCSTPPRACSAAAPGPRRHAREHPARSGRADRLYRRPGSGRRLRVRRPLRLGRRCTTRSRASARVYWTGPSIGFDVGGDANKVFVLVYNLHDSQEPVPPLSGRRGPRLFRRRLHRPIFARAATSC